MKKLKIYTQLLLLLPLCLGSLHAQATRYAAAGGVYSINLNSLNAVVAMTPTIGSDNNQYHLIAPPNSSGIVINESTAQPTGQIECMVNFLDGETRWGISENFAYHRVFAYMPEAGFTLNGLTAYKINSNTFFTLYSNNGITNGWQNIPALGCSSYNTGPLNTSYFTVHFPFVVRIYVKEIPVDGNVIIPPGTIAGYTRLFQNIGKPTLYVPEDKASVKLNFSTAVINYPSNCRSNIDNLNIDHKTLDAFEFNSKETRTVTYTCEKVQPVKVRVKLDYVTDSDPEKRVPLKSGDNTIYSKVTLFDEQTNQSGKEIETTIDKVKNIRIESQLSGSGAEPGDYKGSAWIIATFI
ncbi:MrpH family fimbial adhesin [Providencia sp. PROV129]|uniref:MrpH family fimbial adhesin n=1 Tax=Providencia sp. PROV129 TaxID=2949839 RepID=UPI00234A8FAA|nr:adhesin [Providencia sp. PROV129]